MDFKTLDRLESTLHDNRKKTVEQDRPYVRLSLGERLREYDQMIHLVREFKALIGKAV